MLKLTASNKKASKLLIWTYLHWLHQKLQTLWRLGLNQDTVYSIQRVPLSTGRQTKVWTKMGDQIWPKVKAYRHMKWSTFCIDFSRSFWFRKWITLTQVKPPHTWHSTTHSTNWRPRQDAPFDLGQYLILTGKLQRTEASTLQWLNPLLTITNNSTGRRNEI